MSFSKKGQEYDRYATRLLMVGITPQKFNDWLKENKEDEEE